MKIKLKVIKDVDEERMMLDRREMLIYRIEQLKNQNKTVLHLPRYDKERKKFLDKTSHEIEELRNKIKEIDSSLYESEERSDED